MSACKYIDYSDLKVESSSTVASVTWKIKDVFYNCALEEILCSPSFEFDKQTWHLIVNPNYIVDSNPFLDISVENDGYVYGDVDDDYDNDDFFIFKIGLIDSKGQLQYSFEIDSLYDVGNKAYLDDGLICRKELEAKREELMPENVLTVFCQIHINFAASNRRRGTDSNTSTTTPHTDMLIAHMKVLLKEQNFCDITLQVGEDEFRAHRAILGVRSPVFAAMFTHDMQENLTNIVTIQDILPVDFAVVLDYIYTSQIRDMSIEQAIRVYSAADKYDLEGLKSHCREVLLDRLSTDWFFDIALLADAHNDGKLLDGTKLLARDNATLLLLSDKCEDFFRNHASIALEVFRATSSDLKL